MRLESTSSPAVATDTIGPAVPPAGGDGRRGAYQESQQQYWDAVAKETPSRWRLGRFYHRRLDEVYGFLIPGGQRVLEIGCGRGDLLAALNPSVGVGVDLSNTMLERARAAYPTLSFVHGDLVDVDLGPVQFDAIVLSDVLNNLWDVQATLERLRRYCHPHTRIVINSYSRLWEIPLRLAAALGLSDPPRAQNWLQLNDVNNLLYLTDFEVLRTWQEFLCPIPIPLVQRLLNRFIVKVWPFRLLALANFVIARPRPTAVASVPPPAVSVIVPARNEAGNIAAIFERTPELGGGTELVFVEGHSRDDTYAEIQRQVERYPHRRSKLLRQTGRGKGDAVRLGFAEASGDVLMILDADLTVPPEDLPRFYDALVSQKGEFINGARLVYPMENNAMRLLNLIANKFFSVAFSWLLGQAVNDTLCGTKVLSKADYALIASNRAYFGDFDPFGDYDLLFGAARFNRKIVDLPVRYRERTYGTTNIDRWRHGWLLIKMTIFASFRIKFV
jgi:SAM-dependent methyltransferase